MPESRTTLGAAVLFMALGLAFTQCTQAESDDDDDAGASGKGGTSSAGTGGAPATAGMSATGGVSATGGMSAKGGAPATGGVSATGGGGSSAGKSSTGGSSAAGTAGGGSCDTKLVTVRPPALAPVDEVLFNAQWPALACAAMKPCCGTEAPAYDEAKCLAYAPTWLEKTEKRFDANVAAACFDSLNALAAGCPGPTAYRGLPNTCSLVYRGTLPLGMACEESQACAPDARGLVDCDISTSVCTVKIRGKVGEACNHSCEIKTDIGICEIVVEPTDSAVVTCQEEDGLICGFDAKCQPSPGLGCECQVNDYCNGQTSCDGDAKKCIARVQAGAPCDFNNDCTVDNYCDRDAANPVCIPRKHANEPCTEHDECYAGLCRSKVCSLDNADSRGNFHDIFCDGVGTD